MAANKKITFQGIPMGESKTGSTDFIRAEKDVQNKCHDPRDELMC
jgi:hypothetical protein